MKAKYSNIVTVIMVLIMIVSIASYLTPKAKKYITINGLNITVEIADNDFERMRGLMYRKHLDDNSGMLFIYDTEGRHSFWMKNTMIPLDMLWINSQGKIVYIENSAPPCREDICPTYSAQDAALYVLELPGGYSIKNNIKIGDQVDLNYK